MPEIYLLGGHMKDMKDRARRAISAVAVREHWRMRRVLLLVMVLNYFVEHPITKRKAA